MEDIPGVEIKLGRERSCAGAQGEQRLRLGAVGGGKLRQFLFQSLHGSSEAST